MNDSSLIWAVVVIVVVPFAVIATAEVDERLRQRESPLRSAVATIRTWALPVFALWSILVPVLDLDREQFLVRATTSVLVVVVGIAALRVLGVVIGGLAGRPRADGRGPVPQLLLALPRIALLLFGAWLLLDRVWGVDLSNALTALGVTSLIVSFALQDTLSGLASGFLLVSDRPFEPGDWIEVADIEGMVIDLNWRTTRIRTRNGDMVTVPNGQLANASIVNYTSPDPLHRVVVRLQVAFSNPPTLAKNMLLDAAHGTAGVLADPPPKVRVVVIDDPLMTYDVQMWVDDYAIVPRVRSDFGSLVWYQSHRHGVPLPSPAQDLYLHDAAAVAENARTKPADIRHRLQQSPLFAHLDDADIDRLTSAARPARYAAGELMLGATSSRGDLVIIVEGRAMLVLIEPDHGETVVGDIASGESIGFLGGPRAEGGLLAGRAVTDCEILTVDAAAVAEVASRNTQLAAAFNRTAAIRSRRIDRLVAARRAADVTDTPGTTTGST
jgi:small-conductance mechanosensitive channel